MIELLIATNVLSVAGLSVMIVHQRQAALKASAAIAALESAINALQNLRRNCFLKNERGNRVRYINASPELRAKAEGN